MFREPFTDYIFTWFNDMPRTVSKYFYASHHPLKLLTFNQKVVIPSFQTQPQKKKAFKTIYIPPPKTMKNQWFFQQHLADYPLVNFAASACSLTNMFGSNNAKNNNATIYCLDTTFFTNPGFQYKTQTHPQYGYRPSDTTFLWGLPNGSEIFTQNKISNSIYLGNSMQNQRGSPVGQAAITQHFSTKYGFGSWGNPFFWGYMTGNLRTFQTSQSPEELVKNPSKPLEESWERQNPYVFPVRYNPFKDKGKGNQVYLIPTYDATHKKWEPTDDPDLMFSDFPLWIILWGLEDILKKMGKCKYLDTDWILVIKSKYLSLPEAYYVPLSYSFIHGNGPYDTDREDLARDDYTHWYPRFKYQRDAINDIVMTGPAVPRGDNIKNIQATIKYKLFFKWGGNNPSLEPVYDPTTQPITPTPGGLQLQNEITDPSTNIETFIYPWDFRRHYLTETAAQRITTSDPNEQFMFTDGDQATTDVPLFQEKTQKKKTPETEEEALLQQLNLLQQYNQQLQLRFNRLKLSLQDL